MKKKPRVAVFFGGTDANRDLSYSTGLWLANSMPRETYDVTPVHVTNKGNWQVPLGALPRQGDVTQVVGKLFEAVPARSPAKAIERLFARDIDALWSVVRGRGGDDGAMAQFGETLKIPVISSPAETCVLTGNKQVCAGAIRNIALGPITATVGQNEEAAEVGESLRNQMAAPLFVKPVNAEGSAGVYRVEVFGELEGAIRGAQRHGDVLIQEVRAGTEVSVSVYEDAGGIHALPPTAIVPTRAAFFDSLAKRRAGRVEMKTLDSLESRLAQEVQAVAREIFEALNCRGIVTIDMVVRDDGIEVLEVNTVPTMNAHSPLYHQLRSSGVYPARFVDSIVRRAMS